jgi:16S rRNA (cytosine1402-N4)-methyltransferase
VRERGRKPIVTTRELSDIVVRAIPHKYRHGRIHPATRTFQAIRIAVNRELETLEAGIKKAAALLSPGGKMCVISFHSLEDRIVKFAFRDFAAGGSFNIITPKPLTPTDAEAIDNPSSRSAKLRVLEKI